jgi:RNA polymerase sigma-70 factor (ECF subfamily)
MPSSPDHSSEYLRLITGHQTAIYGYILTIHPDRTAAQDVLQETNLMLWEKRERFTIGTNFKAWAFRFAYLQTLSYRKRALRMPSLPLDEGLIEILAEEAPARLDDFNERRDALKSCIGKLSPEDLQLIRGHYEHDRSLADLSEELGRSRGALKQGLWRIRQALRGCIDRSLRNTPSLGILPDPT